MHLFSTTAAAEFLHLTRQSITIYCRRGMLGHRVNGRWIITGEELARFKATPRPKGRPKKKGKRT